MPGLRSPLPLLAAFLCLLCGVPSQAASRPARSPKAPARKAAPPPVLRKLEILPAAVTLSGPRAERQILVTGTFSDGAERDLTDQAVYTSSAPGIARLEGPGRVVPAGDGTARVRATLGKLSAVVPITVKDARKEVPTRFTGEVVPILTKAGCNQGACHGALLGKGGFRLSLLGYDPEADYRSIVRDGKSRRIARTDPAASLLLLKPVMAVPHAGGMRFKPGSYEYTVLLSWLQYGAPAPLPAEPAVTSVEVQPAERLLPGGGAAVTVAIPQIAGPPRLLRLPPAQRLAAVARLADGTEEDVTRRVQLNSLNDGVARVTPDGGVSVSGKGETAVMVRYRGRATVSRITVPYRDLKAFPRTASDGYIDDLVARKWRRMGLLPSAPCTDAEFMRRVYLDVLGVLPTPAEVREFLAECEKERSGFRVQGSGSERAEPPVPNAERRTPNAVPRSPPEP